MTYVAELETAPGKSTAPVKATIVDRATTAGRARLASTRAQHRVSP